MPVRTLVWLMSAVALAAVSTYLYNVAFRPLDEGGVELAGFSSESTETVSYAGAFPADEGDALANPLAVASADGLFYVAESEAGAVRVFTADGGVRGTIPLAVEEGESRYPADLAVLDDDTLLVVDTAARAVLLVDRAPRSDDAVRGRLGDAVGATAPALPTAVSVGAGRIWVADAEAGALLRYETDGTFVDSVGAALIPPLGPVGSLTGAGDRMYVSDSTSGRVVVLDAVSGEQVKVLDKQMGLPRGVSLDAGGTAYVTDRFAGTVEVFDLAGLHVSTFGDGSRTGAALSMPTDAAWFDETDRLYVVDAVIGRIAVFNVRRPVGTGD